MLSGKEVIPRALSIVLVAVVLAGVCLDPYTWFRNAGDYVAPAPWWQRLLGWAGVALLAAALVTARRRRYGRAFGLVLMETLWAIGAVLILIQRDGESRFIRGLGAEPYLGEYLIPCGVRRADGGDGVAVARGQPGR